jgi:hypothetical protein
VPNRPSKLAVLAHLRSEGIAVSSSALPPARTAKAAHHPRGLRSRVRRRGSLQSKLPLRNHHGAANELLEFTVGE